MAAKKQSKSANKNSTQAPFKKKIQKLAKVGGLDTWVTEEQGVEDGAEQVSQSSEKGIDDHLDDYEKLIGKFLISCANDMESRWSIVVGAPKGRVIIEKYGADQKMVLADSLIEAIEKLG